MVSPELPLKVIEQKALSMLLAGDGVSAKALRNQLAVAKVAERKMTGVGFFLTFALPPNVEPASDLEHSRVGNVYAQGKGLDDGGGFILFVKNGKTQLPRRFFVWG